VSRNTQFLDLIQMTRAEAGDSPSVSSGIDFLDTLKEQLRRVQETMYDDYDWPHLRVKPFKNLAAGSRYYDIPTDMNIERIEKVYAWWNGQPYTLERGIGPEQYASYDSDLDERSDPVQRWDIFWTGTREQIEVWPIPASNNQKLQFFGLRKLRPLVEETDVVDLDDRLLSLVCAAEMLAARKSPKAQLIQQKAISRYERLRDRAKGPSRQMVLDGNGTRPTRSGVNIIRVR
jgi:hypothetical protein